MRKRIWRLGVLLILQILIQQTSTYKLTNSTKTKHENDKTTADSTRPNNTIDNYDDLMTPDLTEGKTDIVTEKITVPNPETDLTDEKRTTIADKTETMTILTNKNQQNKKESTILNNENQENEKETTLTNHNPRNKTESTISTNQNLNNEKSTNLTNETEQNNKKMILTNENQESKESTILTNKNQENKKTTILTNHNQENAKSSISTNENNETTYLINKNQDSTILISDNQGNKIESTILTNEKQEKKESTSSTNENQISTTLTNDDQENKTELTFLTNESQENKKLTTSTNDNLENKTESTSLTNESQGDKKSTILTNSNREMIADETLTENFENKIDRDEPIFSNENQTILYLEVDTSTFSISDEFENVTERTMPILNSDPSNDNNSYESIEHRVNLGDDESNKNYEELIFESRQVEDAVDFGLRKMHELVDVMEPELYKKGILLERNNPGAFLAAFNAPNEYAMKLARYGYASLQAATKLAQVYDGNQLSRQTPELRASLRQTALHNECPLRGEPKCRPAAKRYRTSDGTCNNPNKPWWGSANTPQQRFLPPKYDDGLQIIRKSVLGGPLPSPREISTLIHQDHDIEMGGITLLLMQWGQFLDHDITASAQSRGFNGSVPRCCTDGGRGFQPPHLMHPDCLPIAVPINDWFLGQFGVRCLEFLRSAPTSRIDCDLGFREQINQVTSFIDASPIYGTSAPQADSQRTFRGGLLQNHRLDPRNPPDPPGTDVCRLGAITADCLRPGDGRLREQPALTSFHIAFTRWHNMMATQLERRNPHWSDEKLYQEARRIVGASLQHITYKEFLPVVLGQEVMNLFDLELLQKGYYSEYEPRINPSAANSFTAAAFRFGHSLVQKSFVRSDIFHRPLFNNVSLHEEQSNFENIWSRGSVDRLILGMSNQAAQRRDEFISEELTNHLFQTPGFPFGMDLAAINVQRGRDHGIPPYVAWRKPCGLSPVTTWEDVDRVMLPEASERFRAVYASVEDLDLYSAGLAEKPVRGGLVGPTFACIIAQQFSNLKRGDRFWYENGGFESSFTPGQLQQIRRLGFAEILCRTMPEIETLQPFVFMAPDLDKNRRETCKELMVFDLDAWTEKLPNFLRENPQPIPVPAAPLAPPIPIRNKTRRRRQIPFVELLPETRDKSDNNPNPDLDLDLDLDPETDPNLPSDMDRTAKRKSQTTRRKSKPKRKTLVTTTPKTRPKSIFSSSTAAPTEKTYHDDSHYQINYIPNVPTYRPPTKPVFMRPPQNDDEEISILVPGTRPDDINYLINTVTKKPMKGDKPYNIHIQINYYLNGSDKDQMNQVSQIRPPGAFLDEFPDNPNNPYDQNDSFETPGGYGSRPQATVSNRPMYDSIAYNSNRRHTRPTSPPKSPVVSTTTTYYFSTTTKRPAYSASYYSTTVKRTSTTPKPSYSSSRPYVITNSNPLAVVSYPTQRTTTKRPNVIIIENSNANPFERPYDFDRYQDRPYDYYEAKRPVIGTIMRLEKPQSFPLPSQDSHELPHKIYYMHGVIQPNRPDELSDKLDFRPQISYFPDDDNKYVQLRPQDPYRPQTDSQDSYSSHSSFRPEAFHSSQTVGSQTYRPQTSFGSQTYGSQTSYKPQTLISSQNYGTQTYRPQTSYRPSFSSQTSYRPPTYEPTSYEETETKFVKISSVKGHTTSTKHFQPVFVSVQQKEGDLELGKNGTSGGNGTSVDREKSSPELLKIEGKSADTIIEMSSEELPKPIDFIDNFDDYDYLFGLK